MRIDKFGALILALQDAQGKDEGILVSSNMAMQMWILDTALDPAVPDTDQVIHMRSVL